VPLSITDGVLRQTLTLCFSGEAIAKQEAAILNCADTALTVMEIALENEEGGVDVLQITRSFGFDVISQSSLSVLRLIGSGGVVWGELAGTGDSFGEKDAFVSA
jgi:hypothetical protein